MSPTYRIEAARHSQRGQAMVEFSLVILLFVGLVVALFDLGRGIYTYNGVSEAAREIARRTIVHPGTPLGQSDQTKDTISAQRGLVPAMDDPTFACEDAAGQGLSECGSGNYVRVIVTAKYHPSSLLGLVPELTLSSSSSMQIP
jgi:hypothetical protein